MIDEPLNAFAHANISGRAGVLSNSDFVARILLADEHYEISTGGGARYTQRRRCDEQDDADIFIDARSPLILAILKWAAAAHQKAQAAFAASSTGGERTLPRKIVFDTTNATYFANVKQTLSLHGWEVVDRPVNRASTNSTAAEEPLANLPRLLYFSNSQDTVNELRSLVVSGMTDVSLTCTLLDSYEGACHTAQVCVNHHPTSLESADTFMYARQDLQLWNHLAVGESAAQAPYQHVILMVRARSLWPESAVQSCMMTSLQRCGGVSATGSRSHRSNRVWMTVFAVQIHRCDLRRQGGDKGWRQVADKEQHLRRHGQIG